MDGNKNLVKIYVKKYVELVLKSRTKQNNKNDNLFDIDDLFLDDFEDLRPSKQVKMQYTIDIYLEMKKRKLLIERWNFKYEDNNESIEEMYQFKKLKVIERIVSFFIVYLPAKSITKDFDSFEISFKFYQTNPKEDFIFSKKRKYSNMCRNLYNLNISIEYLIDRNDIISYLKAQNSGHSYDKNKDYHNQKKNFRPRYNSLDLGNKPSFEVLYREVIDPFTINDEYIDKDGPFGDAIKQLSQGNMRKRRLSEYSEDAKYDDNIFKYREGIIKKRISRNKLGDDSDDELYLCGMDDDNSKNKNDNDNITTIKNKFSELGKILQSNESCFKINYNKFYLISNPNLTSFNKCHLFLMKKITNYCNKIEEVIQNNSISIILFS